MSKVWQTAANENPDAAAGAPIGDPAAGDLYGIHAIPMRDRAIETDCPTAAGTAGEQYDSPPVSGGRAPLPTGLIVTLYAGVDLFLSAAGAYLGLAGLTELATVLGGGFLLTLTLAGASLVVHKLCGVYEENYLFSRHVRTGRLAASWVLIAAFGVWVTQGILHADISLLAQLAPWVLAVAAAQAASRYALHHFVGRLAQSDRLARRTIIVGACEHGQRVAKHLIETEDLRMRIIGFVDERGGERVPQEAHGIRMIGDIKTLFSLIRENAVDQVIIALPWSAESRVRELAGRLGEAAVDVRLAPDLNGLSFSQARTSHIAGFNMPDIVDQPISGRMLILKLIEDRVGSLALLVLFSPLMLLIGALIKLDSPGPVIFPQRRFGFNNSLITVYKFRTMYVNCADPDCEVQAARNDPRVTRIGKFLRKFSLDELPQFVNVLKGEMSLVGPRPHAILSKAGGNLFEEVVENYASRHRVKPGITGWAQIRGWRGETDTVEKLERRIEHDLYYIENWSPWFDLRILLVTPIVMLLPDTRCGIKNDDRVMPIVISDNGAESDPEQQ